MAVTVPQTHPTNHPPEVLGLASAPLLRSVDSPCPAGMERHALDCFLKDIGNPELGSDLVVAAILGAIEQHTVCEELWLVRQESTSAENPVWTPLKATRTSPPTITAGSTVGAVPQSCPAMAILAAWTLQHSQAVSQSWRDGQELVIANPIRASRDVREALVARVKMHGGSTARLTWLISLIAQAFAGRQRGLALRAANDQVQLHRLWQMRFDQWVAIEHRTDLGIQLANFLKQLTGSQQVAVALMDLQQCPQLEAVSDIEHFEPQAASAMLYKQTLAEFNCAGQPWQYQVNQRNLANGASWSRLAAAAQSEQVIMWPVGTAENKIALFVLLGNWTTQQLTQIQGLQSQWTPSLALQLQQWSLARRPLRQRVTAMIHHGLRQRTTRHWLIAACCACLLLLLPMPYQLNCDAVVEPVFRKFIATPFEGTLSESLVQAGDTVVAGQVLARLEGAPLRIELAGLEAEFAAARKKTNAALAQGNISDSQIADSESKRIHAKIQLLQSRLDDLEIRSPIDGIIVSGDLTKSTGAPLQKGQVLFEVAPLAGMQIELQIPESDVRLVKPDQEIELRLSAFPFHPWKTQLQRIHPRSEIVDQANVFIAEAAIDNPNDQLRPGMKGHAEISIGWKSVGWIWFHRVWERIQYQWIW